MVKRQYDQYCPVAGALDIIGERWALLIVRDLLLGPKRFVDLEVGLPGIGTNTLTTRLDELERGGVIDKRRLPAPSASTVYELSSWGRGLEPIVYAIARWGAPRLGIAAPLHPLRATWLGVALQAFFRRDAVRSLTAVVELVLPTGALTLEFDRGNLRVTEQPAGTADARIFTSEQTFVDLLMGRAVRSSRGKPNLRIEGDISLLDRIVEAFPLGISPTGPALSASAPPNPVRSKRPPPARDAISRKS